MENMDIAGDGKRYFIRAKHVAIICTVVVVVAAISWGLGVTLNKRIPEGEHEETSSATSTPDLPTVDRGPCKSSPDDSGDWKNFRLPEHLTPTHYDLHVEADLDTDVYTGTVSIHLMLSKVSRHLWLHIRETFISAAPRLQLQEGENLVEVPLKGCFEYKPQEYVVVEATEELRATSPHERYILTLVFQGWLNNSLVGFYKTTYQENGITKYIAATDHEPTDARKSFPCFDEPNKKATFKISITHDGAYSALANMPVEKIHLLPGSKRKTSFQLSVPMSTYLVCFALHQFSYVERTSSRGIPLRIYAQPEHLHTTHYAANVTKIIFDYYETYFNTTYSLPKLDKIAIPDFGTGAMENWGLNTYRESNLLYDDSRSSSYNKQRVASVVSHELVHQWFGNLVTMDWWDDLWLNEGFASYFEYVGVDAVEPSWGMKNIILVDDVLPVMVSDALQSSHPIILEVSSPAEIKFVFDSISYSKGASILRMLEDLLGHQTFRAGCQKYLRDFQFGNAKTSDFWDSLAAVSSRPVRDVMDTWTRQMGYPVLHVSPVGDQVKLTQRRLLLDPVADPSRPPSALQYTWTIPIKWRALSQDKHGSALFNRTQSELIVDGYSAASDGLLKVNKDHIGFYRVNYNDDMWERIGGQLLTDHTVFDVADRAGYVDDVFFLARADMVDYGHAFNLSRYLWAETEYIVWDRVVSSMTYVRNMLMWDAALYPKFQRFYQEQVKNISQDLGWSDTGTQSERLLREIVLAMACQMEDPDTLDQASVLFDKWIKGTRVDVNMRTLVYRYGMRKVGSDDSWNVMFQRYQNETLAQEKDKLLYGLASVENVQLLSRLLQVAMDETVVRRQDVFTLVQYVSYNRYGNTMAWEWTVLNWNRLVERFTINNRNLGRLVARITSTYNTELQLWQMENFFAQHPEAGAGKTEREQALERVRSNVEWKRRNIAEIRRWLDAWQ